MDEIALLALDSVVAFDLSIAVQVFDHPDERDRYRVSLCAERPGPVTTSTGFAIVADRGLDAVRAADTVVVPGIDELDAEPSAAVLAAVREADRRGARMISICTGAFVLAAAGVLDGRPATTHWLRTEPFHSFFPSVRLDPDVLYVDDGDVLTSAGNAAGIDLLLHLVRRDHGTEVANRVARRNVVAPWRDGGQSQFSVEAPPAEAGPSIRAARTFALERLAEPLPLTRLAGHAAMSVRTFTRRFRDETGQSPHTWLAAQRVALARRLLETSDLPVERIAADAGFGTAASLRQHLSSAIGVSPHAYRRTFRPIDVQAAKRRGNQAPRTATAS
jgi:transcriptional regulator GlxA family with amidase domain